MRVIGTVAAQGSIAAIKKGRAERVMSILAPVPVRLPTLVIALVAECLLVCPGEVAMPGEEIGSAVNLKGLVDVDRDEVIKSTFGSGDLGGVMN